MQADSAETRELLSAARDGRRAAFEELFGRHRERLARGVQFQLDRRLAPRIDVADVLQETYLEAVRRLPAYLKHPELPFYLWLRLLARDQVLTAHRRHLGAGKRAIGREVAPLPTESSALLVGGLLGREPTPSQAISAAELAELLRQALARLDDDERELIVWRHFEQLSNREAAQLLGISAAAASKRYIRAVQRLRELLPR